MVLEKKVIKEGLKKSNWLECNASLKSWSVWRSLTIEANN